MWRILLPRMVRIAGNRGGSHPMNVRTFAGMAVLVAACGGQPPQAPESADLTFHQKAQVKIASPAPGTFVPTSADGMVDVAGTTSGSSVAVNGVPVAIGGGGAFHTRIPAAPGVNLVDVRVSGLLGGDSQRAFLYVH